MWVKICGNTLLEDCLQASQRGADAVGFVFAQGKRTVTAEHVAAITPHLPSSLEKIGVFTTQDPDAIAEAVKRAGLTGVQLHSEYHRQFVAELRHRFSRMDCTVRVLQVVQWNLELPDAQVVEAFAERVRHVEDNGDVDALLVDSCTAWASGGTGVPFHWAAAATVLRRVRLPLIVAGGLNPGNVSSAIAMLQPTGVDVSSGVERAPGVKDASAMHTFIQRASAIE